MNENLIDECSQNCRMGEKNVILMITSIFPDPQRSAQ
jgi:hypothetical protein